MFSLQFFHREGSEYYLYDVKLSDYTSSKFCQKSIQQLHLNPIINKVILTNPFSRRENPKLRFHTTMNLKTVLLSVVFLMILCSPFQFFCGMFPVCLSRLRFKNDDWVTFGTSMKMLALNLVDLSKWFGLLRIQVVFHWCSTKKVSNYHVSISEWKVNEKVKSKSFFLTCVARKVIQSSDVMPGID